MIYRKTFRNISWTNLARDCIFCIYNVYSLRKDVSCNVMLCDLVTLTCTFDLLLIKLYWSIQYVLKVNLSNFVSVCIMTKQLKRFPPEISSNVNFWKVFFWSRIRKLKRTPEVAMLVIELQDLVRFLIWL